METSFSGILRFCGSLSVIEPIFPFIYDFVLLQVCSSYILDIVVIDNEFMHMFAKRLAQDACGLSGRHYVSMVLRYCLPTDEFCILGHVVDR